MFPYLSLDYCYSRGTSLLFASHRDAVFNLLSTASKYHAFISIWAFRNPTPICALPRVHQTQQEKLQLPFGGFLKFPASLYIHPLLLHDFLIVKYSNDCSHTQVWCYSDCSQSSYQSAGCIPQEIQILILNYWRCECLCLFSVQFEVIIPE